VRGPTQRSRLSGGAGGPDSSSLVKVQGSIGPTIPNEPRRPRRHDAQDGRRDGSVDGMDSSRFSRGGVCREETWVATTNQEKADIDATTVVLASNKAHASACPTQ
jgi:hypothetical protein